MKTLTQEQIDTIWNQQLELRKTHGFMPADNSGLVYLVGQQHPSKSGHDRGPLWNTLQETTRFLFKLDVGNSYDPNAVIVYREGEPDIDIGYLSKKTNENVAKWLREGKRVTGSTRFRDKRDDDSLSVGILPHAGEPYQEVADVYPDFHDLPQDRTYTGTCRGELAVPGDPFIVWKDLDEGEQVTLSWCEQGMCRDREVIVSINGAQVGFLGGCMKHKLAAWTYRGHQFTGVVTDVNAHGEEEDFLPFEVTFEVCLS